MELGIGYFGDVDLKEGEDLAVKSTQVINDLIEQGKLADQLGLDVFAIGEHHRPDYAVSSPHTLLAGLATVTQNIKLMSAVNVLSSSDPVALYQSFAIIQAMSKGRAEIGIGRGSFVESFPVFGYSLSDYEVLFEEKFELIQELVQNKTIQWSGKTRAPLNNMDIYPKTETPIPIWVAVGGTPASILRAAKAGLPLVLAIIGGNISAFKPLVEYYKNAYLKYGHPEEQMQVGVHAHTLVLPDEAAQKTYFEKYAAQMNRIGKERGWAPFQYSQFLNSMQKDGALVMGTEEQVKEKILYMKELFGLTRYIAHADVGAPAKDLLEKTIHTLADLKKEMV